MFGGQVGVENVEIVEEFDSQAQLREFVNNPRLFKILPLCLSHLTHLVKAARACILSHNHQFIVISKPGISHLRNKRMTHPPQIQRIPLYRIPLLLTPKIQPLISLNHVQFPPIPMTFPTQRTFLIQLFYSAVLLRVEHLGHLCPDLMRWFADATLPLCDQQLRIAQSLGFWLAADVLVKWEICEPGSFFSKAVLLLSHFLII